MSARDDFREGVFARDGHKCVWCKTPAVDAHHIIERRLWPDGGYHLDNGVSLCEMHHLLAESTEISCDELRFFAGIQRVLLPDHLYPDVKYDKWGNPYDQHERRSPGELFYDENVQKVLAPVLHLFETHVKPPRTYHLPWSPGVTKSDRIMAEEDVAALLRSEVVITEKMDGENTSLYWDGLHARSLDMDPHPSRDRLKALHATIQHDIPKGWRICGENVYAKHSIHYHNLTAHFLVFGIWERDVCLSWRDTQEYAALLGLETVPVIYQGICPSEEWVRLLYKETSGGDECEGYVIRPTAGFVMRNFRRKVGKYVRAGHVQQDAHNWKRQPVVPNGLKK